MNGEFLRKAIKDAGYTQVSFAEKLGVEPNTVWRWIRGDISPSDKRKQKIAELLGVKLSQLIGDSEDWMFDAPEGDGAKTAKKFYSVVGRGVKGNIVVTATKDGRLIISEVDNDANTAEMEDNTPDADKIDHGMSFKNIIPPRNMLMIPVISPEIRPSAGSGNNYGYSDLEWTVVDTIPLADGEIAAYYSADNLLSMYVDGDSMEPQIHDGDLVVFNLTQEWVSGNIMVVCLDGRLLVKGLIYNGEGKPPILRSTNKDYPDIHVSENSFFVVYGRVLRIVRMSRPKPVL